MEKKLKDNAIILISVDSVTETSEMAKILSRMKRVKIVYEITGKWDIMVIIKSVGVHDVNDTVDAIRQLVGVTDTNTVIILKNTPEQD